MDGKDRVAVGILGSAVGGFVMAHAISDSLFRVNQHNFGYVRHEVNRSCGSALNEEQFREFIGTSEWRSFRTSLPLAGKWETFWEKLRGPITTFWTGSVVASLSLDVGLSSFLGEDLTSLPALTAGAFLFVTGLLGRVWFFDHMRRGFVKFKVIEPNSDPQATTFFRPAYNSGVCREARRLSEEDSISSFATRKYTTSPAPESHEAEEIGSIDSDSEYAIEEELISGEEETDTTELEMPPAIVYSTLPIPAAI